MLECIEDKSKFISDVKTIHWPIVVYGAGMQGHLIAKYFNEMGIKTNYFCDSNSSKVGTTVEGISVISPDELEPQKDYLIIIAAFDELSRREMVDKLNRRKVSGKIYLNIEIPLFHYDSSVKKIVCRTEIFPQTNPWFYGEVYSNSSESYIQQLFPPLRYCYKNGYFTPANIHSPYVNVENNKRKTIGTPAQYHNKIYFWGDSRLYGHGVEDKDTLPSYFQSLVNQACENEYYIENCSVIASGIVNELQWLEQTKFKKNDIVIFTYYKLFSDLNTEENARKVLDNQGTEIVFEVIQKAKKYCQYQGAEFYFFWLGKAFDVANKSIEEEYICNTVIAKNENNNEYKIDKEKLLDLCVYHGIKVKDLTSVIQRPHPYGPLFIDLFHYGPKGNQLLAEKMFDFISLDHMTRIPEEEKYCQLLQESNLNLVMPQRKRPELKAYLKYLEENKIKDATNAGIIVMNANPFTKGHRYLIETASKQVDFLYVLVVEEDQSTFKFSDRFNMVRLGTADIKNVKTLKSGRFVISSITFSEYFRPESVEADCTLDLQLFGNFISKKLNVKKRFVGTEQFSKITNSYNQQMKEVLPQYDIEVIEIPRLAIDDKIISATTVRKLIDQNQLEELKRFVPVTTYNYLYRKCGITENERMEKGI